MFAHDAVDTHTVTDIREHVSLSKIEFCEYLSSLSSANRVLADLRFEHFVADAMVSLPTYVDRVVSYLWMDNGMVQCARVYAQRLTNEKCVPLEALHRIAGICLLLSRKFNSDFPLTLEYTSRVIGIRPARLVQIEEYVLQKMDWRLFVHPGELSTAL